MRLQLADTRLARWRRRRIVRPPAALPRLYASRAGVVHVSTLLHTKGFVDIQGYVGHLSTHINIALGYFIFTLLYEIL